MSLHPPADKRASLADAAALVTDGALVALGGGLSARLPMALVRELVRQRRTALHLVGSAHSIDVDMLVGAGAVRRCEESYVGFEQDLGLAPAYRRAAEDGTIEVAESCCATILAQLRAAEMGVPFLPVRGVRGSDIVRLHPEYAEITCPFTGETLVAVPPLRPDVALLHAPSGDRYGNLHLEQPYVLDERFASASRMVVATVDELVSTEQVTATGVTIPGHLVAAVAHVPFGAHPSSCYPRYAYDRRHLREYVAAAQAGPRTWTSTWLPTCRTARRATGVRSAPAGSPSWRLVPVHGRLAGAVRMSWTIDEWFVVALARTIRPPGDGVSRLRQPVRAGRDARGPAHPRAGHDPDRGGHVRGQPGPAVHPADQQRRQPAPGRGVQHAVRGVLRRRHPRRRGPDVPVRRADRRVRQHERHRDRRRDFPRRRPKVKLGGGGGGCNLSATIGHLTVWTTRHRSGRTLVRDCDFVTDMGHRTRLGTRAELGFTGGGPQWLVTELGVFDYPGGQARLVQLFPDVSVAEVRAATGFDLQVAGDLRPVPPPSASELAAVRSVDPLGVRTSEFSPKELARTFEPAHGQGCAC